MDFLTETDHRRGREKLVDVSFGSNGSGDTHPLSSDEESIQTGENTAQSDDKALLNMLVLESGIRKKKEQNVLALANRCSELEKQMSNRDENIVKLARHCRQVEDKLSKQSKKLKELSHERKSLRSELMKLSFNGASNTINQSTNIKHSGATTTAGEPLSKTYHPEKNRSRTNGAHHKNADERIDGIEAAPLSENSFNKTATDERKETLDKLSSSYDSEIVLQSAFKYSHSQPEQGSTPELSARNPRATLTKQRAGRAKNQTIETSPPRDEERAEQASMKRAMLSLVSRNSKNEERIKVLDAQAHEDSKKIICLEEELQLCVDKIAELVSELVTAKDERNTIVAEKEKKISFLLSEHESLLNSKNEEVSALKRELESLRISFANSPEASTPPIVDLQKEPTLQVGRSTLHFLNRKAPRRTDSVAKFCFSSSIQSLVNTLWPSRCRQQTVNDGFRYLSLGNAQKDANNHERALSLYHLALVCQKRGLGESHPKCAATLEVIGVVQQVMGEKQLALFALEEAMSIYRFNFGDDSDEVTKVEASIRSILYGKK